MEHLGTVDGTTVVVPLTGVTPGPPNDGLLCQTSAAGRAFMT